MAKTECDNVDAGLDCILYSQWPPDPHAVTIYELPEASSIGNLSPAKKLRNIWWIFGTYF